MAGTVMLEERVERAIVTLFCRLAGIGGKRSLEDEVTLGLRGRFAAWKVSDGLKRLREAGVTVSASEVIDGYNRRCWRVADDAWEKLALFELEEMG